MTTTGLFLISAILRLRKKFFDTGDDSGYLEIAASYCCDLASGIVGNSAYDKYKDLAEQFKRKGLPVNNDIHKAAEKSLLLSTLEAVKYCQRISVYKNTPDNEKLTVILRFLHQQLNEIASKDYLPIIANPATDDIMYLQLNDAEGLHAGENVEALQIRLQDYLIREKLLFALYVYLPDCDQQLPHALLECVTKGWQEQGKQLDVFTFMCEYFHEFLKEDKRLAEIIQKQWLSTLLVRTQDLQQAMEEYKKGFGVLGNNALQITGRMDKILSFVNPQPFLTYTASDLKQEQLTHYRSRYTPFWGRQQEIELLTAFFNRPASLEWSVVTAPGGTGKSRLAMELCYHLQEQCNLLGGFMSKDNFETFDWVNWQPEAPTLIVLDYASALYERFITVLEDLEKRKDSLAFPVRCLLLERTDEGTTWWKELEIAFRELKIIPPPVTEIVIIKNSKNSLPAIVTAGNSISPIRLKGLEHNSLKDIVQFVVQAHHKTIPDNLDIQETLEQIDPHGRPLFAVMAALSIVENEDIRGWSKTRLLDEHYMREASIRKKLPLNKQVLQKMELLAAFATITGGLALEQLSLVLDKQFSFFPSKKEFSNDLYRLFAPVSSEQKNYLPIEPDIIGEYFVLKQLESNPDNPFEDPALLATIPFAWQIAAKATSIFTERLFQDFPEYPASNYFLEVDRNNATPETLHYLAVALGNVFVIKWSDGHQEKAQQYLSSLITLEEEPAIKVTPLIRMVAISNALNNSHTSFKKEDLDSLEKTSSALFREHKNSHYFIELLRATTGILKYACLINDTELAVTAYEDFINLLINNKEAIREYALPLENNYSYTTYFIIKYLFRQQNKSLVINIHNAIADVMDALPQTASASEEQANIYAWMITGFAENGFLKDAWDVYTNMHRLADNWPDNAKIQETTAGSGFTILHWCLKHDEEEAAKGVYPYVENFHLKYPYNQEITQSYAGATHNLVRYLGEHNNLDAAATLYEIFEQHIKQVPFPEKVFPTIMKMLNSLLVDAGEAHRDKLKAIAFFDRLQLLMDEYFDSCTTLKKKISELYLEAVANMLIMARIAEDLEMSYKYVAIAKLWVEKYTDESLMHHFSQAMGNHILLRTTLEPAEIHSAYDCYRLMKKYAEKYKCGGRYNYNMLFVFSATISGNTPFESLIAEYNYLCEIAYEDIYSKNLQDAIAILALLTVFKPGDRPDLRPFLISRLVENPSIHSCQDEQAYALLVYLLSAIGNEAIEQYEPPLVNIFLELLAKHRDSPLLQPGLADFDAVRDDLLEFMTAGKHQ